MEKINKPNKKTPTNNKPAKKTQHQTPLIRLIMPSVKLLQSKELVMFKL